MISTSTIIPNNTVGALTLATIFAAAGCSDGPATPLANIPESNLRPRDVDGDQVNDGSDNCPLRYNPADESGFQPDSNGDGVGNACDATYCIDNQLDPAICADHLSCPSDQFPLLPRAGIATFTSQGTVRISFPDPSHGMNAYFIGIGSADPTDRWILGSIPPDSLRREVGFVDHRDFRGRSLTYYISTIGYPFTNGEPCLVTPPLEIVTLPQ